MRIQFIRPVVAALALVVMPASIGAFQANARDSFQNNVANCTVRLKPSQAREFVLGAVAAPMEERCLGAEWAQATFRAQTYRYALAKVLLKRDYTTGLPSELLQLRTTPVVGAKPGSPSTDRYLGRLSVADCVVRKDPTRSFALVGADAGEAEATPLMLALAPVIADCSSGKQLRYPTGFEMHEAIVTRMYQLAYAAKRPR